MKRYTETILGSLLIAALITTLVIPRKQGTSSAAAIGSAFAVARQSIYSIFGINSDPSLRRTTSRTQ